MVSDIILFFCENFVLQDHEHVTLHKKYDNYNYHIYSSSLFLQSTQYQCIS